VDSCRNTISKLRRIINRINTFIDSDQCIRFLESLNNEKAFIIISGALGQQVVPIMHDMPQLHAIFIFCGNKSRHEQWAKDWPKIKSVSTKINDICERLKPAVESCNQATTPISFVAVSHDASCQDLDRQDPSFMYTQILKEILLDIDFGPHHFKQFIEYCRKMLDGNEQEMKYIKNMEHQYRDKPPIWWYTYECFLYPMLNFALRTMDVDIIIKMGFFVRDLHRNIEKLHKEQFSDYENSKKFMVYRAQGLSNADFEGLRQTKGGLMSFNNFLSTSKDRSYSLSFARSALKHPDLSGVLFQMTIDPSKSSALFASIGQYSYFQSDGEILFSMPTIFRIGDIKQIDKIDRLWQVDLTLTTDGNNDLRILTDYIRKEIEGPTGWHRLGKYLLKLGEFNKADEVYQMLLEQTTINRDKSVLYNQLGLVKNGLGEYKEAIMCCERALDINKKTLPSNHFDFAETYNNIGLVYQNIGEYSKALSYHEKALEIRQKSLPPNHPDVAQSYNNIGLVRQNMGDYSKALYYHEKAMEIQQKTLPPKHPDLAQSYNNIGLVYQNMGEYSKALSYHEKALEIQQETLPPKHPDLAQSYNNIGLVYQNMGEYSKALSNHEKALNIIENTLPPNHPDVAQSYNNIGLVRQNMGDYSKALSYHEKAMEIRQQALPPNHPDLAESYNNIGLVYENLGQYAKALSFCERSVRCGQSSLPANHPKLQTWKKTLELVNHRQQEYCESYF
jgi:tetratricopeptide (TPR) repeat protein